MIENARKSLAHTFRLFGVVLVLAGAITLSGWVTFDLMNINGLLGYSIILSFTGFVALLIAISIDKEDTT